MQLLFRILSASNSVAETRENKIAGILFDLDTFYAAFVLYSAASEVITKIRENKMAVVNLQVLELETPYAAVVPYSTS